MKPGADRLLAAAGSGDADALLRLRQRVPRLSGEDDQDIAARATQADARIALAREYGFRTWGELAEATDTAKDTHYSRLPPELPWKRAEAAIRAGDADTLRSLLQQHPGLECEDPGATLLCVAAQPEAGQVPREVVDVLIESGSALDDALSIAACFNKPDMAGWLLDAGADPHAAAGVLALQSAAYHGSREAADILVSRAGIIPDVFYLVPLENTIGQVTCGSCGRQAACVYSLIRPLRTGFRRIRSRSRSVMAARGASRPASGTRWAMP